MGTWQSQASNLISLLASTTHPHSASPVQTQTDKAMAKKKKSTNRAFHPSWFNFKCALLFSSVRSFTLMKGYIEEANAVTWLLPSQYLNDLLNCFTKKRFHSGTTRCLLFSALVCPRALASDKLILKDVSVSTTDSEHRKQTKETQVWVLRKVSSSTFEFRLKSGS